MADPITAAQLAALDTLTPESVAQVLNLGTAGTPAGMLLDEARAAVVGIISRQAFDVTGATIPPAALRRAVLDVAGDTSAAELAPAGVRAFAGGDGSVIRVTLDNTRRARTTLAPYLVPVGA